MKHYNIPYSLIEECVDDNTLSSLYYYYKLRNIFKNRVFYNWSYRSISYHLNVSTSVAYKHIQVMKKKNWIQERNSHLCLIGINRLKGKSWLIRVPIESDKKKQLLQFRYVLIHKNLTKQQELITKKTEIVKIARSKTGIVSKIDMRLVKKSGGLQEMEKSINNRVSLSNKKIGFLTNRSSSTGKNYQRQWNEMKLIESKPFYCVINTNITYPEYVQRKNLGYYNDLPCVGYNKKKKVVYSQLSNSILIKTQILPIAQ